ncbi:hypothetical protein FAES_5479 [Fibrella aestuarina BUZ 2]|uniref:Uncharacterized protein n=1 Tax=Fibrella aestuarina BUZ 2 TaxID=1166018 RepID=I0KH75_9BACT|nr:hypothetical protein [Fibrella aestuarina]CCH03478.1 hypothetical protein FAES_5479 [Fibrella aestuarina BUZ 2]
MKTRYQIGLLTQRFDPTAPIIPLVMEGVPMREEGFLTGLTWLV